MAERLGYLLKHAQLRFFELSASALAPLGISGQEAAVLRAIDYPDPLSQGDVARRMRIDRTTMVALIDDLERKGLAQRRQDPGDRRRNVVELTGVGRDTLRRANQVAAEAEQIFLSPLPAGERERFMTALRALLPDDRAELPVAHARGLLSGVRPGSSRRLRSPPATGSPAVAAGRSPGPCRRRADWPRG
jgi:DNA-binding MarR family transcriptional regulator